MFQDRSLEGKITYINGCFKGENEDGHWTFSDSLGNVTKEGNYSKGILQGQWEYSYPNQQKLSIFWKEYENHKFKIKTNIPDFLNKIEEGDTNIRFDRSDTSTKLTLVIILLDSANLPSPLDQLYLQSEKEMNERGWSSERQTKKIDLTERDVYMNWYKISKDGNERFVLESYGAVEDGKVLMVISHYDLANDAEGRILFTSVTSNLFFNGKRYMRPYLNGH